MRGSQLLPGSFHIKTCLTFPVLTLALLPAAWGADTYTALRLQGGGSANGINGAGHVTGQTGLNRAFLWDGTMHDLGTLGGGTSFGSGINDSDQVVGGALPASGNNYRPFLYSGGVMQDLGLLPGANPTYASGSACCINNHGKIAGTSTTANGWSHAFLYSGGVMTDLGSLSLYGSYARGINDLGQVVGYYDGAAGQRAFLWDGTMHDLGTLGGIDVGGIVAVNASAQVAGSSRIPSGLYHPFLYSGGTMIDLDPAGTGGSAAYGINDSGQIVGSAFTALGSRAMLFTGGTAIDLNTLVTLPGGEKLQTAWRINNAGQIIAYSNASQIYLLTPVPLVVAQTITFGALSNQPFGTAPFSVSATATSGLLVSVASTTSSVCSVSGNMVTLVAAGQCSIQATQSGNASYSAAAPVTRSFQVTPGTQIIAFGPLSNQPFGTVPFSVSATATSGLPVSFASTTLPVCTISGTIVTLAAAGQCSIQASQVGNANYSAAASVTQSFQVTQGTQTITFGALPNEPFGTAPFGISATATSGLTVSVVSTTLPVCTISGNTMTLMAVGQCSIQASQAGNANYSAAAPVTQSFQVTQGTQTITFAPPPNVTFGVAPFTLTASATSGLTVTFTSTTLAVCTASGNTVTILSGGQCSITANQTGNANWLAAPPQTRSFQVMQAPQTINFGPLSNQILGVPPFNVSATATSGLAISFASLTTAACTVSVTQVTLVNAGNCSIQATQPGNGSYLAALPVTQSFTVTTPAQAIQNLLTTISTMGLPNGVANSLSATLKNIDTDHTTPACEKLDAFIKKLDSDLTQAQANLLLNLANAIKASLGC